MMIARIDEHAPGQVEARLTMKPAPAGTAATEDQHARFASRAEAEAWVRARAAAHRIPEDTIVWQ